MNDDAAVAALEQHVNPEPETPAQEPAPQPAETPKVEANAETPEADKPTEATETPETAPAVPVAEGAKAPVTGNETPEDDEIDWTQFLPQATDTPVPKPDENGQVDVQEYINHQLNTKLQEQANELRGWQQATKVLPEIAKNPQLREFVHNQRLASVATGKTGDLAEAAKSVKAILSGAQAEGKANATASVEVQNAAGLETGGTQSAPPDTSKQDIADRINAGDASAVQELLADWIDQGAI